MQAALTGAPARTASRDRIMALLWPEKDTDQARHLLSMAVYEIRKELGEDVLITRGDDLVLEPAAIGSDLDDFRAALDGGDCERAIALYRGPFLDGFHLTGSAPFDHWAEEVRDELTRRYRRALEDQAVGRERDGDLPGAVDAWRKLAADNRYDGRVATRLVQTLAAAGNRAGALQFARVHETLVRDEFGTDPDPAFLAAVEAARTGGSETVRASPATTAAAEPATSVATRPPAEPAAGVSTRPREPLAAARASRRAGRVTSILRPVVVVSLIAFAAAVGGYLATRAGPPGATAVSVAVLPFTSPDSADEAFAAGLSEAITDVLGKVDGLSLPAWSASVAMAGVPAREAAQRMGVGHVVTGSVRRQGDRLRIRVEMSGADGIMAWSESYEPPVGEVFEAWDRIAVAVLDAVAPELQTGSLSPLVGGTSDPVAYDLYTKGRHTWLKRTPEGLVNARRYFAQALEHDPRYARALAGLADAFNLLGAYDYGVMHPDSAYPRAIESAERALRIAPDLAEAHAALANARFAYLRDWAGADAAYRRALQLNPRYAEAHHWYSLYLIAMGRDSASMEEAERALALDSLSPVMRSGRARHRYFRGDYDGALAGYQRALEVDPTSITARHGAGVALIQLERHDEAIDVFHRALDLLGTPYPVTLGLLGHAYGLAGRHAEARDVLETLRQVRAAGAYVGTEYEAIIHLGLGDVDAAIDALAAAVAANSGSVAFLAVEPLVRSLRSEPRFRALMARVPRES